MLFNTLLLCVLFGLITLGGFSLDQHRKDHFTGIVDCGRHSFSLLLNEWKQRNLKMDETCQKGADTFDQLVGECDSIDTYRLQQSVANGTRLSQQDGQSTSVPLLQLAFDMMMVTLIGLVCVATAFHWRQGNRTSNSLCVQLLLSFSVLKNLNNLIQMPIQMNQPGEGTIGCLFGIRFLAMAWTLAGHSFIFVQAFLDKLDEYRNEINDNFWNQWISNFTLSVDVFFLMSGTLTAYSWFGQVRRQQQQQQQGTEQRVGAEYDAVPLGRGGMASAVSCWLRFYRHRLFRLWPAYAFALFAVNTRVGFTHYYPGLPPTDVGAFCRKHWPEHLLFINSLTNSPCLFWTWYLGTEFIFFLLSPLFLVALRRSAAGGLSLVGLVTAASVLANLITMHQNNFPPQHLFWRQPAIFCPDFIKYHYVIYVKPWYRIGPYLVGIVLGYALQAMRSSSVVAQHWLVILRSRSFVCIGWTTACCAGFWPLFGLYPALQAWEWPLYHLFFGGFSRIVFALAISWVIFACHCGVGSRLNRVLSMRPLLPLSQLSYSAYLFHMIPVMFTYKHSPFSIDHHFKLYVLMHCALQLLLSYTFGIVCSLMAEQPALNIEHIFLSQHTSKCVKPTNNYERKNAKNPYH